MAVETMPEELCRDEKYSVYALRPGERTDPIALKIMQSTENAYLLRFKQSENAGRVHIHYDIEGYQTLEAYVPKARGTAVFEIVASLLMAVDRVYQTGFLRLQNFRLALNDIFVDVRTNEVKLVYIPVRTDEPEQTRIVFDRRIRECVVSAADFAVARMPGLNQMIRDFYGRVMLGDILTRIHNGEYLAYEQSGKDAENAEEPEPEPELPAKTEPEAGREEEEDDTQPPEPAEEPEPASGQLDYILQVPGFKQSKELLRPKHEKLGISPALGKILVGCGAGAVLLAAVLIWAAARPNPFKEFKACYEQGDIAGAADIYAGMGNRENIKKKIAEYLHPHVESTLEAYINETLTDMQAKNELDQLLELGAAGEDVREVLQVYAAIRDSRVLFRDGEEKMDAGLYNEAIAAFRQVDGRDILYYEKSLRNIEIIQSALEDFKGQVLSEAARLEQSHSITEAIAVLENALDFLPDSEEIKAALARLETEAAQSMNYVLEPVLAVSSSQASATFPFENNGIYELTVSFVSPEDEVLFESGPVAPHTAEDIVIPPNTWKSDRLHECRVIVRSATGKTTEHQGYICMGVAPGFLEGAEIIRTDDEIYIGRMEDERRNGNGVLYGTEDGSLRMRGVWINGIFQSGYGRRVLSDGVYWGNITGGRANGQGTLYYFSGQHRSYTGSFLNDLPHGQGELVFSSGVRYSGAFKNGKAVAGGIYRWPNGNWFSGTLRNGQFFSGTLYDKNGKVIEKYAFGIKES